jgi:dTDP-glucose 4,6-dehydratase
MEGRESDIIFPSDRPGQVVRHAGDYSKIKRLLGWEPSIDWEEGLKTAISWYTSNRSWWEKQIWMRHIPIVMASGRKEYH